MKTLLRLTAAPLALSLAPAFAQEAPIVLDEIVVTGATAALTPQPLNRTGATVDVIDGTALENAPARPLADALAAIPGVTFSANGGLGTATTLRIRGLDTSYIGVRLDGLDVTDPSGTQTAFDFGGLTGAGIGRVEVIRGSQSALYGSEAIAGVVDIRTARGTGPGLTGEATVEAGSFATYAGSARLSQTTETGQLSFNISRIESEGISARAGDSEKDGFDQSFATLTGDADVSDTVTLGFSALWRDADLEIDRSATDNSGETSSEQIGGRVFALIDGFGITHEIAVSAFETERRDPGGFTTAFDGTRREASYLGTAEAGSTTLTFGTTWSEEEIDTDSVTGDDTTLSALGEAIFRPTGDLDVAVSLRHDDSDDFGGQTTGRVALAWQAAPGTIVRAVAGTGFRAPSLFERFSSFGDPDLEPEESRSFELGVEQRYGAATFVRATAFYTEIDELIRFDPNATACASGFGCYNQVPGTTTTQGVELSGSYAFADDRASLYGSYTYTDAETEDGRLARVPRHDLFVGVEGRLTDRLTGRADLQLVSDVEASEFAPADNKVGDYTLAGLGLTYALSERFDANLRVENLFDEDYETAGGFNTPGRAAYVSVTARF